MSRRYFGGKFKMTKSTYQNPVLSALEFVNNSKTGQEPLDIAGFQILVGLQNYWMTYVTFRKLF